MGDRGQRAAADTEAVIVAPTLVSDRFVQLTEPYVDGPELRDGTVIEETAVPVEIDDLYASLTEAGETLGPDGANQNGALSRFLPPDRTHGELRARVDELEAVAKLAARIVRADGEAGVLGGLLLRRAQARISFTASHSSCATGRG